jgi:hypothetical protein
MKDAMKALRAHAKKPASQAHGPGAKLAKGGVTTQAAQQMGRNMARAANQGAVGRKMKG